MSQSAPDKLIALALACRPDWREADLRGALLYCAHNGWNWDRTLQATARLIAQPDGEPRDLIEAAASPLARRNCASPAVYERGAAMARQLMRARDAA